MKYIIIVLLPFGIGCECFQCDGYESPEDRPLEFKPIHPNPFQPFDNLLHEDELKNIARKSVTKKDYECEEEC
jgi:hypothetical protein|tara:strand:- start:437 stop:655 length:219 start_codon:yes stop_codon:yes gene_type:complete